MRWAAILSAALAVVGGFSCPGVADDSIRVGGYALANDETSTIVTLRPTTEPEAVAEIEFQNRAVNGRDDNSDYPLSDNGIDVIFRFRWNVGGGDADAIMVDPGPGRSCSPADCMLVVDEGSENILYIYSRETFGF